MSFLRARILLTYAAVALWLTVLAGRQFGLSGAAYEAASLVVTALVATTLAAAAGGMVWGRVGRRKRRKAARAMAPATMAPAATGQLPSARTGSANATGETLARQAVAATGAVGCAAVVIGGQGPPPLEPSQGPGQGPDQEPDQEPVFSAVGRSGRRGLQIGPDTRFEIGSVTKIFTGLLLADMTERAEVDLDAPLGTLLGVPAADALTLRSLATHTSGLPRRITRPRLGSVLTVQPDPFRGTTLDHVTAALARRPPATPGPYQYSNVGYQLLAAALAKAAGTTWEDLLQQRITEPLGLNSTSMSPDNHTARGHDEAGLPYPYPDYTLLPGAMGLFSTARDLASFLKAQLDPDSTPLGPAIRLSRTVHTPAGCSHPTGLGWRLKTTKDATMAWHSGLIYGFSAMLALTSTPGAPRGLAILANSPCSAGLRSVGLNALRSRTHAPETLPSRK